MKHHILSIAAAAVAFAALSPLVSHFHPILRLGLIAECLLILVRGVAQDCAKPAPLPRAVDEPVASPKAWAA